jgi:hypothetical protein
LEDFGREVGIDQNRQIRLPQHIDESRSDHLACGIDGPLRGRISQSAYGGYAALSNGEIACVPGGARSIDDPAIAEQKVVLLLLSQQHGWNENHGKKQEKAPHDCPKPRMGMQERLLL